MQVCGRRRHNIIVSLRDGRCLQGAETFVNIYQLKKKKG